MIRKRLVSLFIILFGLSILTFGLTYLLPSDPVEELITSMGGSHDPEIVEKLEEQYGTSRPFFVQYIDWIKGVVLHGDFGISVKYNKPVKEVIAQKLPNTVKLACTSFLTMVLIAFPLGILSAVYKGGRLYHSIPFFYRSIDAELLVWYASDLDFGGAPWLASGGRFVIVEAYYYADVNSGDGHELLLYPPDPCSHGGAAQ